MSRFGYRNLLAALVAALLLLIIQPVSSHAAPSGEAATFLKLSGITGSYSDEPYKGAIEVLSYSFSSVSSSSVIKGGYSPSKPDYSDITITKQVDNASLALLSAAAKGKVIPHGYLYFVSPNNDRNEPYMIVHFTNLLVTGYQVSTDQHDAAEVVTLHADTILFKYMLYDSKGNPKTDSFAIGHSADTNVTTQYHFDPLYATTVKGDRYIEGFRVSLQSAATGSSIDSTRYRINGGNWTTYSGPFDIYAATTHKVEYYSTDKNGNIETVNVMNFDKGTFIGNGNY
ncbi:type VI secretion system tube protein Hcp [Paenibacillus kobensis]|uniref:type VI secretion system tube protein Hcp n=1 Tax=Paenibacillus kobensis TaxID=59841 RepID=UPI0013E3351C|nr:type VI secretion system tube protein Hcp [Paenibacillus kobensis]